MFLDNIRKLCEENHITIKDLERETGLGNGVIARWGEGKAQLRGVIKVAEHFNTTVDALVNGKPDNSPTAPTKEQLIDRMLLLMEGAGLTLVEAEDVADELVKAVDRLNSEAYEKMLFHREPSPGRKYRLACSGM